MGADLLPTMAAMSGTPLPEGLTLDGINLLPHLIENKPLAPRPLFWQIKKHLAVRHGDYKLITNAKLSAPALYNLMSDPGETQDIAAQHPETVQELLDLLTVWYKEVNRGVKKRT